MIFPFPGRERSDAPDEPALVTTPVGTLRGTVRPDGVRAFRGIPFAQPPVGPLRFAAPRKLPRWEGVRDALRFALPPVQSGHDTATSSEDCLYLNVWTPPVAPAQDAKNTPPYPVFVWVHGGGNNSGWSGGEQYDHAAFATSGVVTVTLSYRVGAPGFLELGDTLGDDYADSGNNGLRDLVLGLRWVRDNIAAFGGDPSRITLGGESAGGKNVAALLASPQTRGLIRRVVIESGSAQTVHTRESAREVARHFLDALGIAGKTPASEIKMRLLGATTSDLLKAQARATAQYQHAFPFRAVVGSPFLSQRPVDAFASGVARDIPLLIGTNRDESLLFFARRDAEHPIASRELSHLSVAQIHAQRPRYDKQIPGLSPLDERVRLLTAEEYWIPSVRVAEARGRSDAGKTETYMYRFDHLAASGEHAGYAPHASEVAFVWNHLPANAPKSVVDLSHRMHQAWVAFVANGVPVAAGMPEWSRYAGGTVRQTMVFQDAGDALVSDPRGDERVLWDGVL